MVGSIERPDWTGDEVPAKETPAAFPPDRVIEKAPLDDRGRVIRSNWSFDTPAPGENDAPFPDAPVEPGGEKPTFTPEDLSHIDSSGVEVEEAPAPASVPAGADPLAALDAEDQAKYRNLLKQGIFSPDDLVVTTA